MWIVIECAANLIEVCCVVYFLNSRLENRLQSQQYRFAVALLFFVLASVENGFMLLHLRGVEVAFLLVLFFFLLCAKKGSIGIKSFYAFLTVLLAGGANLISTFLLSVVGHIPFAQILQEQNLQRVMGLILCRIIQIILFWLLTHKHVLSPKLPRSSVAALFVAQVVHLALFLLLYDLALKTDFSAYGTVLLWSSLVCIMFLTLLLFLLFELLCNGHAREMDWMQTAQRNKTEQKHAEESAALRRETMTVQHDMKHHMQFVLHCLEEQNVAQAKEYLLQQFQLLSQIKDVFCTGNIALDALLSNKITYARSEGIKVETEIFLPASRAIPAADWVSLIGNLMDNAIEACLKIEDHERSIRLQIRTKGNMIFVLVENTFTGELNLKNGTIKTKKDSRFHGFGLRRIDEIAATYQGWVDREQANGIFKTQVYLFRGAA